MQMRSGSLLGSGFLFFVWLVLGCAAQPPPPTPAAAAPDIVHIENSEDTSKPDILWIVREVPAFEPGSSSTSPLSAADDPIYGLFACTMEGSKNQGKPVCYLAEYEWKITDLGWPGLLVWEDGVLTVATSDRAD